MVGVSGVWLCGGGRWSGLVSTGLVWPHTELGTTALKVCKIFPFINTDTISSLVYRYSTNTDYPELEIWKLNWIILSLFSSRLTVELIVTGMIWGLMRGLNISIDWQVRQSLPFNSYSSHSNRKRLVHITQGLHIFQHFQKIKTKSS